MFFTLILGYFERKKERNRKMQVIGVILEAVGSHIALDIVEVVC